MPLERVFEVGHYIPPFSFIPPFCLIYIQNGLITAVALAVMQREGYKLWWKTGQPIYTMGRRDGEVLLFRGKEDMGVLG